MSSVQSCHACIFDHRGDPFGIHARTHTHAHTQRGSSVCQWALLVACVLSLHSAIITAWGLILPPPARSAEPNTPLGARRLALYHIPHLTLCLRQEGSHPLNYLITFETFIHRFRIKRSLSVAVLTYVEEHTNACADTHARTYVCTYARTHPHLLSSLRVPGQTGLYLHDSFF